MKTDKKKTKMWTELAYVLGIVALAVGTAFSALADFGMSMVVAPAYLVHLKLSAVWPGFTFGMAEYCLQALLLVLLAVVMRRFKPMYLFSFVTAVFYGLVLDLSQLLLNLVIPTDYVKSLYGTTGGILLRSGLFVCGILLCAFGVALLFHTYVAPEAYELVVKEISGTYHTDIGRTKTIYDITSCIVAVILSFVFFGLWHFEGVKVGTVICALVNGFLIGRFSKILERVFDFTDGMPFRKWFEK